MCGRYRNQLSFEGMSRLAKRAAEVSNARPSDDIRPTTRQWVVRAAADGTELTRLRWWLVPYFHRKPIKEWKAATFNARSETVATAASFKSSFQSRRCLVLATGWDEWVGDKGGKQRWTFAPKGGGPLTFGGIWDKAVTPDEGVVESFAIITQPAGSPLNGYHDRAPVVIWEEGRERWLAPGEDVTDLIGPESADRFEIRPVSKDEEAAMRTEAP